MDRELEELRHLGYFGIVSESIKIIHKWRITFLNITLTLIVPLSFLFLSDSGISVLLKGKIIHNRDTLDETTQGTVAHNRTSKALSMAWTEYILINVVYFFFVFILSLLSTSAVVYTVACAYSGREITYAKVMRVVPKVWKKLTITFLCNFAIVIVYNICAFAILFALVLLALRFNDNWVYIMMILFFIAYAIGFVHIVMIWQLASVVSVLEESSGFEAMARSKALIKGSMVISLKMFVAINFFLVGIPILFEKNVMVDKSIGVVGKVGFGVLSLVLLSLFFLFGLVVQTVMYFVCKAYHKENIDKSALSDHLDVYDGGYVPLKPKNVQMEQI